VVDIPLKAFVGVRRRLEIVQRRLVETVKELPFLFKVVLVFRNDVRSSRKKTDDQLDRDQVVKNLNITQPDRQSYCNPQQVPKVNSL